MALQVINTVDRAGMNLTAHLVNCDGAGDSFINTGSEYVVLFGQNFTATMVTQSVVDGQAVGDRTIVFGVSLKYVIVGPFPTSIYNDAASKVQFTYDNVTAAQMCVCKNTGN